QRRRKCPSVARNRDKSRGTLSSSPRGVAAQIPPSPKEIEAQLRSHTELLFPDPVHRTGFRLQASSTARNQNRTLFPRSLSGLRLRRVLHQELVSKATPWLESRSPDACAMRSRRQTETFFRQCV